MLLKGREAGEKIKAKFSSLSIVQLNWKPDEENWSIGQCLDHLGTSDCLYFPSLKKITERKFKMSFWESWSPLTGLFGKMLVNQLQEKPRMKMKAPKIFAPSESKIDLGILEQFHKHLDSLREYINDCRTVDLDKTYITSPVSKFVTYSLRNAITLLIQHEHRHINQAIKVKHNKNFPAFQYARH